MVATTAQHAEPVCSDAEIHFSKRIAATNNVTGKVEGGGGAQQIMNWQPLIWEGEIRIKGDVNAEDWVHWGGCTRVIIGATVTGSFSCCENAAT